MAAEGAFLFLARRNGNKYGVLPLTVAVVTDHYLLSYGVGQLIADSYAANFID